MIVFEGYDALPQGQHYSQITDPAGWARYVAKHGARSESHYQRLRGMLPAGWQNTGRVWGTIGDWPVRKEAVHLSDRAFYAFRRVATRLLLSDARRSIVRLEARLADSANARQKAQNRRLLEKARSRLPYLQQRLRRREPSVGRIAPVSDWLDSGEARRWLQGACVPVEYVDQATGEVSATWYLRSEPVVASAARSQHWSVPVPGGVTGSR